MRPARNPRRRSHVTSLAVASALAASMALAACGGSVTGPQAEGCGSGPYFTVLPVAATDIDHVTVLGGLDAPGHTLPTAHAGLFLTRENVPVRSPGDLAVTQLRRVTYLTSPSRQGERDYAVFFQACKELTGWFGHVTSLAPTIPTDGISWNDCDRYSTSSETVESCTANDLDIKLAAGSALGTGGLSFARGFLAVDFGTLDDRVDNFYVSPGRHPDGTFRAVCPWEQFDAVNRSLLFSKLRDGGRPDVVPAGEPRCGTMAVDVAGTAKGVWVEPGVTGQVQGDETRYITLAAYPYRPQDELALSLAPTSLGAMLGIVPRQTAGRVNRAFEDVSSDGQVYCYGPDVRTGTTTWLLQLTSGSALRMERVNHPLGASPCLADVGSWSFGTGAVSMVR